MLIESTRNDTIKLARALSQAKGRREQGRHFIEGEKLVREAIASGAALAEVFIESGYTGLDEVLSEHGKTKAFRIYEVSRKVMESLSDTKTPQHVCAAVKTPDLTPPDKYPAGLIVALDGVQDPGNLGTILRTADAFRAKGLLLGAGCADPFAPKPLRAAMGSHYHVPIWQAELKSELLKLNDAGANLICGHLHGKPTLPEIRRSCVLVIGNEGRGVSDEIASVCHKYKIRMPGAAESLNASVAAGILIYEIFKLMNGGSSRWKKPARV